MPVSLLPTIGVLGLMLTECRRGQALSRPIATLFGGFGRIGITDMDCPLATHVHPHLHAIIKLDGADTSFRVRDTLCPVTANSAVLVNAWEPHAWTFRPGRGPTRFLTLYLDPKWLSQAGFHRADNGLEPFFGAPCVDRSPAADRAIADLVRAVLASGRIENSQSDIVDVPGTLAALIHALHGAARPSSRAEWIAPAFDYRIRRAMGMLYQREELLSVETVADAVGLSRPRFFELFKHCTGVTPNRISNAARMERAISLLAESDVPMGELALHLNFSTPGNFSRFFRSQIGLSPHAFRRSSIAVHGKHIEHR
ncbi:helix-turn-helix domain-containing protein [Hwanghaeella grinnelliae]|uniref:helix-turn-helix domain-containing protein n=1 Tax=Hwanghaeella grinnelliae TaxID=2500179 RepID=UPI001386EDE0|nr:AraC family transcriptional regulator [Hwanghaeella grinnelliae]